MKTEFVSAAGSRFERRSARDPVAAEVSTGKSSDGATSVVKISADLEKSRRLIDEEMASSDFNLWLLYSSLIGSERVHDAALAMKSQHESRKNWCCWRRNMRADIIVADTLAKL